MADEHLGLNARLGVYVTQKVGSMWSVYITVVFVSGWIVLATTGPLLKSDPYPFPFLLFLGNLVQLMLVFVILVGQGVLGRTADRRAERTFKDAEAILHEVTQLHSHLQEQDKILNNGTELVLSEAHPWLKQRATIKPAVVSEQYTGLNGRIAATITKGASTLVSVSSAASRVARACRWLRLPPSAAGATVPGAGDERKEPDESENHGDDEQPMRRETNADDEEHEQSEQYEQNHGDPSWNQRPETWTEMPSICLRADLQQTQAKSRSGRAPGDKAPQVVIVTQITKQIVGRLGECPAEKPARGRGSPALIRRLEPKTSDHHCERSRLDERFESADATVAVSGPVDHRGCCRARRGSKMRGPGGMASHSAAGRSRCMAGCVRRDRLGWLDHTDEACLKRLLVLFSTTNKRRKE